jgi:xylulokinase
MILAYDIGTTFLKGAVVTENGKILARAQVPIRMVESADRERYEWDADAWLSGMALVTAQLGLRDKGRLRGVVVSANGPTLVPVNADCEPLALAMSWMDRRAREEAELIAEFSDSPVDPSFYLPKAFWVMRHEPELYEKTRYFLPCAEFIDFFLTGNPVRILPTALFSEFYWNEGAVPRVRLDPEKLPPFVEPGELIGPVSERAADILGLPPGIPVIAGGPDYIMSIIGTASMQAGRTCDRAGTSEGVNLCWSAPVRDPKLLCFPHLVRGLYNVSAMFSTSGSALDWAARSLGSHKPDVEALLREVQGVPAGSDGLLFLPFLSPERFPIWDPNMRGAFVGLTLAHGRREMMRAVVESTGFAVRSVIAAMEASGCHAADLRVTGSQTRLPLWCQVRADVTGKKVLLPEQEDAELVGNACVGFFGLGDFESLPAAAESLVRFQRTFVPDQRAAEVYDEMFARFSRACACLGQALSR